jgi:hypothetical protein
MCVYMYVFVCMCTFPHSFVYTGYLTILEIILLLYIFVCVAGGLSITVLPKFEFL